METTAKFRTIVQLQLKFRLKRINFCFRKCFGLRIKLPFTLVPIDVKIVDHTSDLYSVLRDQVVSVSLGLYSIFMMQLYNFPGKLFNFPRTLFIFTGELFNFPGWLEILGY